jgi:hypothetical protein
MTKTDTAALQELQNIKRLLADESIDAVRAEIDKRIQDILKRGTRGSHGGARPGAGRPRLCECGTCRTCKQRGRYRDQRLSSFR